MAKRADVRVDMERAYERELMREAAPAMDSAADIVAEGQRRRIPVSRDGSHGRPAGFARSQIHVARGTDADGPFWDVGTGDRALTPDGTNYPLILELGSRAHEIRAGEPLPGKKPYPLRNRKTGQVFGRVVQHPGTMPYPWLRAALADLAGRTL